MEKSKRPSRADRSHRTETATTAGTTVRTLKPEFRDEMYRGITVSAEAASQTIKEIRG
jgi:hypothetical protein